MADPLLTDEQIAEAATNPVAASDDAGSVSMPSIADLIALRKYLDASTGGTGGKPRNPFKVLGGMQSTAAHRRLD